MSPGLRRLTAAPRGWLALIAVTVAVRLPALLHPRAIDDEAVYGVVARVMLAGGLPYRDAIERKPPLLFAVYWAIFRLLGDGNWLALHLVAVVWVLLTMAGLAVLAGRLAGRMEGGAGPVGLPRAGMLAALAYALVQPWATAKNLAFNGEVLINLPLVWAYALVLGRPRGRMVETAVAGALLAAGFLLKQPAAIAALPLGLYLLGAPLWRGDARAGQAIARAAALSAGFAAVLGAAAAILWHDGLLGEAWYWTVADHAVPHVFWLHGAEHTALFLLVALPLVLPLFAWPALARRWAGREAELWCVLGWLAASIVGAAAGGRFYPHYYIQIVPPLAVLAGVAWARADTAAGAAAPVWLSRRFALCWLAVAAAAAAVVQWVQLRAERAPSPAGAYVAAHAGAGDRLFVWGQQTSLYLDAAMLPASRYIATFPLTGYIFGGALPGVSTRDRIVPGAWANLAADLDRHPPRFIIDTQAAPADAYPLRDFAWIAGLVARRYRPVAAFAGTVVYRRCDAARGSADHRISS